MDFRVGASSPTTYAGNVQTSKNKQEKNASFASVLKTAASSQDSVSIKQKTVSQRLDYVHQKIDEMDFTGKSNEEIYKSINDVYEDEFGHINKLYYSNDSIHDQIDDDWSEMLKKNILNFKSLNKTNLRYKAMGYDKMTDAEKMASIKKRIPGNTIADKLAILSEMHMSGLLTDDQCSKLFDNITYNAEKDYCRLHGLDYMEYKYSSKNEMLTRRTMEWSGSFSLSWDTIFSNMRQDPRFSDAELDLFFEELNPIIDCIKKSEEGR